MKKLSLLILVALVGHGCANYQARRAAQKQAAQPSPYYTIDIDIDNLPRTLYSFACPSCGQQLFEKPISEMTNGGSSTTNGTISYITLTFRKCPYCNARELKANTTKFIPAAPTATPVEPPARMQVESPGPTPVHGGHYIFDSERGGYVAVPPATAPMPPRPKVWEKKP